MKAAVHNEYGPPKLVRVADVDKPAAKAQDGAVAMMPDVRVSDRHRKVQSAAFALLLNDGHPVSSDQISAEADVSKHVVEELLADFDRVGRVRFNDGGHVVGIAGLSIEPTRHRLEFDGATRWTWCALDAIGILGALHREATFTTQVPDSDEELSVGFGPDGAAATQSVVFMADGYGRDSVVDTWCPTVNMFPTAQTAITWGDVHGVAGRPIPVGDLAADATAMWTPVTVRT